MHWQTTAYVTANAMMILANAHYNCLPEWLISPILAFGIMLGGAVGHADQTRGAKNRPAAVSTAICQ